MSTVYRLAASGDIPAFKLGGAWRFSRSDIQNWIRQQTTGSPVHVASKVSKKENGGGGKGDELLQR
ncbi:MAG: helix-turn-helix domain-containing protein [Castellaniella sp.]